MEVTAMGFEEVEELAPELRLTFSEAFSMLETRWAFRW